MPTRLAHPNEPGRSTLLDRADTTVMWRRDGVDPVPVSLYYVLAPPQQAEVLYDEAKARAQFAALSPRDANQAA